MNIRTLLASAAALTSAVVLSSCAVDGYGYSGTYSTGYDSCDYGPSYYGTTVYSSNYYTRPRYSDSCYRGPSYPSYRPYSGRGSYCPPSGHGGGSWNGGGSHGGGSHGGGSHSGSWSGGGSHAPVMERPSHGGGFRETVRESRPEPSRPVIESRPVVESRPPAEHSSSGGGERVGARTFGDMVRDVKRH